MPEACPACGGELYASRGDDRFEPTYVGKTSLDLHSTPPIGQA